MAVNWALGVQQGPNPFQLFQQGLEAGRARVRENFLMQAQRQQMAEREADRSAQVRAGKHVAIGDLPGARAQAAESGSLELVQSVNQLSADQRAQAAAQAQTLAPVYHRLRQIPDVEQRRAELQRLTPALVARGIPADVIATYDPTDQNLESDIALGMTLEQVQQQGRIRWVTIPGVGAVAVDDATGRPVTPGTMENPLSAPQQGEVAPAAAPAAGPIAATGYAAGVASTLAQAGVPQPVIAGILGNGEHESGGRWNRAVGDNGTAFGAFQWRHDRVDNFQRITGAHPSNATPEQTAQFVLWELQNPREAGMTQEQAQAILNARTPDEAARLFSRYYERPNRAQAHDDRRVALAARYAGQGGQQQYAQAAAPPQPGQQRSLQDQAATGVIQAPRPAPPGYQWTDQGTLAPIPGGPGDQTYQRSREAMQEDREGRRETASTLNNFNSDPEVRQFRTARVSAMQIQRLAQSGSPADDVALIFSFMRVLDPNSTVREGEFATAQQTAGLPDRIVTLYNQAIRGSRLSPVQRQQFVATSQRLYLDRARSYNEVANNYREQLRAMGVPEDRIGRLVPTAEGPQREDRQRAERAQAPPVAETARRVTEALTPGTRQTRPTIRVLDRRPAQ